MAVRDPTRVKRARDLVFESRGQETVSLVLTPSAQLFSRKAHKRVKRHRQTQLSVHRVFTGTHTFFHGEDDESLFSTLNPPPPPPNPRYGFGRHLHVFQRNNTGVPTDKRSENYPDKFNDIAVNVELWSHDLAKSIRGMNLVFPRDSQPPPPLGSTLWLEYLEAKWGLEAPKVEEPNRPLAELSVRETETMTSPKRRRPKRRRYAHSQGTPRPEGWHEQHREAINTNPRQWSVFGESKETMFDVHD